MAENVYECMFILNTGKVSGDVPGSAEKLHAILQKHSAEILASRPWGDDRRLAYPIKKHKKGLYYLTYFRADPANIAPIREDFALNDLILRSMILKVDPKLVDTMLTVARDEHALVALHSYQDEQEEGQSEKSSEKEEQTVES